ncbi:MAG TPA: cellulose biosynthesis protein BcsQ [Acidobacteriaceae bacterium]|nr:cellulose biosynthesis protein BcsQ [Acidobacteriaceae bacterium]
MPESNSTGPKSSAEQGEASTPDDVATLYSWANLHGAKYRDFSASRAVAREETRLRAEEAAAEERRRQEEEAERQRQEGEQLAAEAASLTEEERLAEIARQAETERETVLAAQEAQRIAAPSDHDSGHDPGLASASFAQPSRAAAGSFSPVPAWQEEPLFRASQEQPASVFSPSQYRPELNPPVPQESFVSSPWQPVESREPRESRDPSPRPAWLAPEPASQQAYSQPVHLPSHYGGVPLPAAAPAQSPVPMYAQPVTLAYGQNPGPPQGAPQAQVPGAGPIPAPAAPMYVPVDDPLSGPRERSANRWYALKSVFDSQTAPIERESAQPTGRVPNQVPVLAVFSLAGGVGKTSLVASLGRALSSRGERVLLIDTAAYGLLPFFFGARDQRPGLLRTFSPPGVSTDAPIQLVTLDPEGQPPERSADANPDPNQHSLQTLNQDWLAQEVGRYTHSANRVLIDLPTASGSTTRRVLRLAPVVLVPVLPDMNSVVSVGAIEAFFRHNGNGLNTGGRQIMPYYVLNQFDYSLPLHLDVREILREQIGDRLLPFALRRSPAVSEALAEGMTVMDYAPSAVVAEDYANLAGWVRSLNAPAAQSYRGVRWSER